MKGIRRVHLFERRCVCKVYRVQTGLAAGLECCRDEWLADFCQLKIDLLFEAEIRMVMLVKIIARFILGSLAWLPPVASAEVANLDSAAALAIRDLPPDETSTKDKPSNFVTSGGAPVLPVQPQASTYPFWSSVITGLATALGSAPVCNPGGCSRQGGW
ncbi:hypothetical protein [Burkholderia stagnalis]